MLGDLKLVRDVSGDKGWTSIVPMQIGETARTDLLFYNAVTGRAAYAVTTSGKADQTIVRDVSGDKGSEAPHDRLHRRQVFLVL